MDATYREALEAAPEPRAVLLGPAPCKTCGAWVEWAGVAWLALGEQEPHRCEPFLVNGLYKLQGGAATPRPQLVARSMIRTAELHPVEPAWVQRSEKAVWLAVSFLAALLLLAALLGRQGPA